jgi:AraC-like DNA-binding protein
MSTKLTNLLRIPDDLAAAPESKLLKMGELCFAECRQLTPKKPLNVFVTEHTLIFVTKGAKIFHFRDKKIVINSGQALFLERGSYVLCQSIEENNVFESVSVFFPHAALNEFWNSLDNEFKQSTPMEKEACKDINMVVHALSPALERFHESIANCFFYEGKFLEQLMKVKIQELLLLLLETPDADEITRFLGGLYAHSLPDPIYTVSQNLFRSLSINDYAQLSNRSLSKFKRDFRESAGQPPGKWINSKRLQHAHMLTKSTRLSISEICDQSGFNNLSNFIRSYKTLYGKTPASER